MGLFDAFTGSGGRRAADVSRTVAGRGFDRNIGQVGDIYGRAGELMRGGAQDAMRTLEGGFGDARSEIGKGQADAVAALRNAVQGAQGSLGQARGAYGEAGDRYAPLENISGRYGGGVDMLFNALGLRGDAGNQAARTAFEGSLIPDYMLDRGLDAISRRAAAAGGGTVFGGNVDRAAQDYGMDVARQQSGDWLNRLQGFIQPELAAAGTAAAGRAASDVGRAGLYGQEAGLLERGGRSEADIAQGTATRLANLATGGAGAQAGIQEDLASRLANLALGQGQQEIGLRQQNTQDVINSIMNRAAATGQASSNIIGAGSDLVGALATILGGRVG